MKLLDAIEKMLNDNGEIYFDTTTGWYERDNDFRTGGQDIIYLKKDGRYIKSFNFVAIPNQIVDETKETTLDEICKELNGFSVTSEEVLSGTIINRAQWECKG